MLYAVSSLNPEGDTTDRENNLVGTLGELLVNAPGYVSETTSSDIARDNSHAYLVCHQDQVAGWRIENIQEGFNFWRGSIDDLISMGKVSEPDCYAVQHQHFCALRQRTQGSHQVNRLLQSVEGGIPLTAMDFNAGSHLIIGGFSSGNEGLVVIRDREFQGMLTLAASATPGYNDDPFHRTLLNLSRSKSNGFAGKDREPSWSTEAIEIPNPKSQISNNKQITMTKIQNSKPVLVIEYWNLRFVYNLVLGI
jgi:hypothetical protein